MEKYEKEGVGEGVQLRGAEKGEARRGGGAAQSLIDDSLYAQHPPHGEEPPVILCNAFHSILKKNKNIDTAIETQGR